MKFEIYKERSLTMVVSDQKMRRLFLQLLLDPLNDEFTLMRRRVCHHNCILHVGNCGCVGGGVVEEEMVQARKFRHGVCHGQIG